ncbi:HTH_Tnp_Tc3_2 domain-containing protein [Trichonephila clavipes]|nr:HTH_Tnp_Tc3_2 domain-containing protein [Trichonephila clavipes]
MRQFCLLTLAIQPEARFIAKQNSLMKIGNNGNLVLGPFDESTPCLMIVLMNCQTKLRINHLTAVKSVANLESDANLNFYTWKKTLFILYFDSLNYSAIANSNFCLRDNSFSLSTLVSSSSSITVPNSSEWLTTPTPLGGPSDVLENISPLQSQALGLKLKYVLGVSQELGLLESLLLPAMRGLRGWLVDPEVWRCGKVMIYRSGSPDWHKSVLVLDGGRIIGRLECGRYQLEVSEELGITQSVKRNRRSTASDLSHQLSSATGKTVSRQTMYRRLGHIGLYARRPVRCVPLIATHCRLRLTWSREHALWTPQQWSCVMFSDEYKFSLQSDSRRTLIWRAPGTRYHQENSIERHFTVVQDGSCGEELFLVPELTCMFRV